MNCSSKSEYRTEKGKSNEPIKQSKRKTYKSHKMCISALKFVCCCSEKHSLPIYVYRGKGTNNHLLEKDLEYEKYCNHWKKSFYYLQTLVMTKIEEGDIKNTNHCHIYRKKYGISRVSVILEDLRM